MRSHQPEKAVTHTGLVCHDCFRLKKCKEPVISWVFFAIALVATITIRAVNVVLDFSPLLAKVLWYIGVGGFFVFFVYKYRYDTLVRRELERTHLVDKLLAKDALSDYDYEIVGSVLCKMRSKMDGINYFFIFFSSAVALLFAIYIDFFR